MFTRCRVTMLVIAAGLLVFNATAQTSPPYIIEWQRTFGGTNHDRICDIKPTGDGGYLLVGTSTSGQNGNKTSPRRGEQDLFVVKIGADGKRQWDRSVGNGWVTMSGLVTTADGGFVLGATADTGTAQTKSDPGKGNKDYWLMKFDGLGRKQWDRTYGGTEFELLRSVSRTADGGYLLAGMSHSEVSGNRTLTNQPHVPFWQEGDDWIVKTDALGRIEWQNTHRRTSANGLSAQPLPDGGYLYGDNRLSFEKVDAARNIEWRRSFAPSTNCYLSAFRLTPDGGFIAAGFIYLDTGTEFLLVRVNGNWELQWHLTFGGSVPDKLHDVHLTSDGGCIAGGVSYAPNHSGLVSPNQIRLFKFDASGNKQWEQTFKGGRFDGLSSVRQTKDGGYILGLSSNSVPIRDKIAPLFGRTDFWVIKLANPDNP